MGLLSHHGQLTEVFIEGDENPTFLISLIQDLLIAWINRPVSRPDDIVSCNLQWSNGATPDAGIEQKLHEAVSRGSGSIRS